MIPEMTVEKALRMYTDSLLDNRPIQLSTFKHFLSPNDFNDFIKEAGAVDLIRKASLNRRS